MTLQFSSSSVVFFLSGNITDSVAAACEQIPVNAFQTPRWSWQGRVLVHGKLKTDKKASRIEEVAHTLGPVLTEGGVESAKKLFIV